MGGGVVHLVQVDDVPVLHLGQDVDLLSDVLPGHPPPRRLQPLLLDELGRILRSGRLLHHPVHHGKLSAEGRGGAKRVGTMF